MHSDADGCSCSTTLRDLGGRPGICWTDAECPYLICFRFTLLPLPSLDTPRRHSETATSPSTQCWERRTSVSERTGASTTSASRLNFQWQMFYSKHCAMCSHSVGLAVLGHMMVWTHLPYLMCYYQYPNYCRVHSIVHVCPPSFLITKQHLLG